MCGLFGFVGRLSREKRRTLLKALAVYNVSRGDDSTGLAVIDRDRNYFQIYKEAKASPVAVNERGFINAADDFGQVWIGHTRAATRGAVNDDNSHPFKIGDVIGAHNGMITVSDDLKRRCDGVEYPVDSQYLFHLLNRDRQIGEISGYAALAFVHLKDAMDLTFIRDGSTLSIARLDRNEGIVWSSDSDHLYKALSIAGVRGYKIESVTDDKRYDVFLREDGKIGDVQVSDSGISHRYQYTYARNRSYSSGSGGSYSGNYCGQGYSYDDDYPAHGAPRNTTNISSSEEEYKPVTVRRRKSKVSFKGPTLPHFPMRPVSRKGDVGQIIPFSTETEEEVSPAEARLATGLARRLGQLREDGAYSEYGDALKRLAEEQEREIEEDAIRRSQRIDHEQYGYALSSDDLDCPLDEDDTVLEGELAGFDSDVNLHLSKLPRELR